MENTRLEEIYDGFLSKISDYTLLANTITEEDINEELFGYFKSASRKFYKCRQDLKPVDDGQGLVFAEELHPYVIETLIVLMIVEYMRPLMLSTEVTKQSLSDKDFRIYSQANQLRELSLLHRNFKKEARKMITEYTFIDLNKENYK